MIEKLKNLWADDEIRPAIQLLAAFLIISTAFLWLCFPDGSLLVFMIVSAILCIPFAFAFNYLATLVFAQKERLRALEITGIVVLVIGSALMMASQQQKRDERLVQQVDNTNATAPHQISSSQDTDESDISRSTILILVSLMMIYGGYRLSHWSAFQQGELSVTDASP